MMLVLDASAVIALVRDEPGADTVRELLATSESSSLSSGYLSAVNLTEVIQELEGHTPFVIEAPQPVIATVSYDVEHARVAAAMHRETRKAGLGIADRACLALAKLMSLPAVTADRLWSEVDVGVEVIQIR